VVTLGSEDHIRCCTPASFEASARFFPCATSISKFALSQTINWLVPKCYLSNVILTIGHSKNCMGARYGLKNRFLII